MTKERHPDITDRPEPTLKEGFALYDYQEDIVKWMREREQGNPKHHQGVSGGILAAKMGLGKTLSALEHTVRSQIKDNEKYPTLVVVSKTLMYEWMVEGVNKFYDNMDVLYLHRDFLGKGIETVTGEDMAQYNLVITTYDCCLGASKANEAHMYVCEYGQEGLHKDKVIAIHNRTRPRYKPNVTGTLNIYSMPWERVICDESQRFANPKTYHFKAMMAIYGKYKWCLTGTPVRNRDTDVWSQFRFCGFNSITAARLWRPRHYKEYNLARYMKVLNYKDANVEPPKLVKYHHEVELDTGGLNTYMALFSAAQKMYEMMVMKLVTYATILALFTRLRQICIAPHLIYKNKTKRDAVVQNMINEAVGENQLETWIKDPLGNAGIDSPKIKKAIEIIEAVPKGEKVIIFSMFVSALEILEEALKIDLPDKDYEFMCGSSGVAERVEMLKRFKSAASGVDIIFMHYKVGGEGLNLTEANHVIFLEPWWCPAVHGQALARCHRRGQKKTVHAHWIILQGTIEIPILKMCENKDNLANYYLKDIDYSPEPTGLSKWALKRLIEQGAKLARTADR